jgi:hypothetical protein
MYFILDSNQYSERGDAINAYSYAKALKEIYDIDSTLTYNANGPNNFMVLDFLKKSGLNLFGYSSEQDFRAFVSKSPATHTYFYKKGVYDARWAPRTKNLIHAVFGHFEPHGDVYAYISDTMHRLVLSRRKHPWDKKSFEILRSSRECPFSPSTSTPVTWVPFIVDPPSPSTPPRFRELFSIPTGKRVIGRIGGWDQMDDPDVWDAIARIILKSSNVHFVFINTKPHIKSDRITYVNGIYISGSMKADFFSICDLTINARLQGESFGFAICESLFYGVPVLAPSTARNPSMDPHHISVLSESKYLYDDSFDFEIKLERLLDEDRDSQQLKDKVSKYSKKVVMQRFESEFF